MSWTQPICRTCWDRKEPGRTPVLLRDPDRENCCLCGDPTWQGIYIRIDPSTVPFPRAEQSA